MAEPGVETTLLVQSIGNVNLNSRTVQSAVRKKLGSVRGSRASG